MADGLTQNPLSEVSIDTALGLYNLEKFELLVEPELDTRCLVAWNQEQVVVSFR